MSPDVYKTLLGVALPLIIAWATWVTVSIHKQRESMEKVKLHMAEHYAKKELIDQVFRKLDELSGMVHSIAGKLSATIDKE